MRNTNYIFIILIFIMISCNQTPKGEIVDEKATSQTEVEIKDTLSETSETVDENLHETETSVNAKKCNGNYVLTVVENIDNLDTTMVSNLLRTINESCQNDAEFGEFSNETLFKVLEKRPDLFLETYEKLRNEIDTAYILFELRNPIHDLIPIRTIIDEFEKLNSETESKKDILRNLKKGDWTQ